MARPSLCCAGAGGSCGRGMDGAPSCHVSDGRITDPDAHHCSRVCDNDFDEHPDRKHHPHPDANSDGHSHAHSDEQAIGHAHGYRDAH